MSDTSIPAIGNGTENAVEVNASLINANTVSATGISAETTPATGVSSGVDIVALTDKLNAADSAYKGLQTKYNQLYASQQALAAEKAQLQTLINGMEKNVTDTTTQAADLSKQIADLTAARDALQADVAKGNSKLSVYEAVDAEFPYLRGMAGKLPVGDTPEVTRQILSEMNELVKGQVDQRLAAVVGDYNSGGNMQRGSNAVLTLAQMKEAMLKATGKPEFDSLAQAYYAAYERDPNNEIPRPPADPLDEFNNTLI